MGHSHPYFQANRDNGVMCGSSRPLYGAQLEAQNDMNADFSPNDRNTANAAEMPMYLVVPDRRRVRMHMPR